MVRRTVHVVEMPAWSAMGSYWVKSQYSCFHRLITASNKAEEILLFSRSLRADSNKGLRKYLVWESGHRGRCQIATTKGVLSP